MIKKVLISLILFSSVTTSQKNNGNYKNFIVSVYARAYEVREMKDTGKLDSVWNIISRHLKIDKIYLETHLDNVIVDENTIEKAKKFFHERGIKTAGGITYTIDESNRFETFCYSNPEHRKRAKEIAELTAGHFDEFILDDFFFTNCKCGLCIKAKGDLSWTDFRLKLMTEAASELVINPSRKINPDVKVIIKFPNWYEHFQGLGFNLKEEPELFDGIYTGTETRDPVVTQQHLQQYESYLIYRYFVNIKPGGNGGGWVDPFASFYLDRYAEQLWLTLFAKAPEITLFDFRSIQRKITGNDRAPWQSQSPCFNFDELISAGDTQIPATIAKAAGYTLESVDKFLGELGNPVGIKSYKPYHSTGEDYLHNYFGMIGIPVDLVPEFPEDEQMILLTESSAFDPDIAEKIKNRLRAGRNVMITSGLLRELEGKGIEDIVELKYSSRKSSVKEFVIGRFQKSSSKEEILIPQIQYFTNDSWEEISALDAGLGWPLLHSAGYEKGTLFVLVIPDNFADLYNLPADVLNKIRQTLSEDISLRLEGPSMVSLLVYDNNTFIVQSFLPEEVSVKIITEKNRSKIKDIISGEEISGEPVETGIMGRNVKDESLSGFEFKIKPHSYRVFSQSN